MKGPFVNLGIGIIIVIGTNTTNAIISSSIRPMDTKLAGRWLRMSGHHPQSQVTLQYHGHMTNKICYISTFTRPIDLKLSRVVTKDEET